MYTVDDRDTVISLKDFPPQALGAPHPVVLAGDYWLDLVYQSFTIPPVDGEIGWETILLHNREKGLPVAHVRCSGITSHMFGFPYDEVFHGHPLAQKCLETWKRDGNTGALEVKDSSWIRALEKIDSVYPSDEPSYFARYRLFIFIFKECTFECVAEGYRYEIHEGSIASVATSIIAKHC